MQKVGVTETNMADLTFKNQEEMEAYAFSSARPASPPRLRASQSIESVQPAAPAFVAEVSKQLESLIPLMEDKDKFLPALAQVEASVAAKHSDFMRAATAEAYTKHNVMAFEKAVQDGIQQDDMAPGYRQKYGSADSDETLAARKALNSAKSQAEGSIPEILKGNPAYLSFDAYSKSRIDAVKTMFMKRLGKEEQIDLQAEIEMSGYMPEQRAALEAISGFTDPVQQWKFTQAQGKNKQFLLDAISSTPEHLALQTLGGNPYAERLVRQKEQRVLGAEEADKRLGMVARIVADPVVANKAFQELVATGGVPAARLEEYNKKATTALMQSSSTNKEEQKFAAAFRRDVAMQVASHTAQKAFDEDMLALRGKSKVPLPSFLEEASKDLKTGTISKEKALFLVKEAPSLELRKQRLQQLSEYYQSAADTQNESIFFKIQPLAPQKLLVEASLLGVFGQAADKIGGFFPKMGIPDMTGTTLEKYMQQSVER